MVKRVLDSKIETRDDALGEGDLDRINGNAAHPVTPEGDLGMKIPERETRGPSSLAQNQPIMEPEAAQESEEYQEQESLEELKPSQILKLSGMSESVRRDLDNDLGALKSASKPGVLMVMPKDIKFETQDVDEQVILVLRQHPVVNIRWIGVAVLMALLPILFLSIDFLPANIPLSYLLAGTLLWELVVLGFVLEEFLWWFFNLYIVTNQRIVDIDFHNLLSREISDADLLKIQDVTVSSRGILAAVFNFGDIAIQTAAERAQFEFQSVAEPEKVASVIRELSQQREEKFND